MPVRSLQPNTPITFPSTRSCRIRVAGGSIVVASASSDAVVVTCFIDTRFADRYRFTVDTTPDLVLDGRPLQPGGDMNVRIVAEIPLDCVLDLRADGGAISVGRREAAVAADTRAGSIQVAEVTAALVATASGGSITVDAVSGPATVSASGGSIVLSHVSAAVDLQTSGGSARVAFSGTPDGHLRVKAGSLQIAVPRDAAFRVSATAEAGSITVRPPLVPSLLTGSRFVGAINGGGTTTLEASVSAGNIALGAA